MGHKDGDEVTSEGGGSIAGNTERKVKNETKSKTTDPKKEQGQCH